MNTLADFKKLSRKFSHKQIKFQTLYPKYIFCVLILSGIFADLVVFFGKDKLGFVANIIAIIIMLFVIKDAINTSSKKVFLQSIICFGCVYTIHNLIPYISNIAGTLTMIHTATLKYCIMRGLDGKYVSLLRRYFIHPPTNLLIKTIIFYKKLRRIRNNSNIKTSVGFCSSIIEFEKDMFQGIALSNPDDLNHLLEKKISCIVNLCKQGEIYDYQSLKESQAIDIINIETEDMVSPAFEGMKEAVLSIHRMRELSSDYKVYIHCRNGEYRSVIFSLCYLLLSSGKNIDECLLHYQKYKPSILKDLSCIDSVNEFFSFCYIASQKK